MSFVEVTNKTWEQEFIRYRPWRAIMPIYHNNQVVPDLSTFPAYKYVIVRSVKSTEPNGAKGVNVETLWDTETTNEKDAKTACETLNLAQANRQPDDGSIQTSVHYIMAKFRIAGFSVEPHYELVKPDLMAAS